MHNYKGITPTLFVGLGNIGGRVLSTVERSIENGLPSFKDHPIHKSIRLDSSLCRENREDRDFIDFTQNMQDLLSQGDLPVLDILPEKLRASFTTENVTRLHFHAAFYLNLDTIREQCRGAIDEITSFAARSSFQESTNFTVDEGLNVYIITSLWEAAATGILWDIGTLLRRESEEIKGPLRITGFFLIPDESILCEECLDKDAFAVSAATIREMRYFLDGKKISIPISEKQSIEITGNPFDISYIVPCHTLEIEGSKDPAEDEIQRYILADLDPYFSPRLKSGRDQLSLYLDSPAFIFGIADISLPVEEIIDWCSNRLVLRALQQWGKKENSQVTDDDLRRFYKIMEIRNPEKACEEFIRKMGSPKETAWHFGRQLKELGETYKKDELISKLEEEYRRLGADEVTESSRAYNIKINDSTATHKKLIAEALMDMAGDCTIGLHKLKSVVTALNTFFFKTHEEIEKRVRSSAMKIEELDRERLECIKALKKLTKSPFFFLNQARMSRLFEETWKTCERSFEERLTLHILTSGLFYFHSLKDYMTQFKEPVAALIEIYEFVHGQMNGEAAFSLPERDRSLTFIDARNIGKIYGQYAGSEEKTICGVISHLLSLIPLDLTDLTNKRVYRDLKNGAPGALYSKARQCFESIKEKQLVELMQELLTTEEQEVLIKKLFTASAPHPASFSGISEKMRKLHLLGFYEGSYPQHEATIQFVKTLAKCGVEPGNMTDLIDENRILSLIQYSGISLEQFQNQETLQKIYDDYVKDHYIHITGEQEIFQLKEVAP